MFRNVGCIVSGLLFILSELTVDLMVAIEIRLQLSVNAIVTNISDVHFMFEFLFFCSTSSRYKFKN